MAGEYDREIYEEAYAIRAEMQSMNVRYELQAIGNTLKEIQNQLTLFRKDFNQLMGGSVSDTKSKEFKRLQGARKEGEIGTEEPSNGFDFLKR